MIHSVWGLCRACPGKADEKVHTEYKRNYTWHSNYQPVQQDIIKKPPDTNASCVTGCPTPVVSTQHQSHHQNVSSIPASASTMEPSLPRKKKHPEVAYRNHQVLNYEYPGGESSDSLDSATSGAVIGHHVPFDLDDAEDFLRARSEERSNAKCPPSGPRSRSADPSLGGRKGTDENQEELPISNKMTEYQLSFARRKYDGNVVGPQEAAQQCSRQAAGLPSGLVKRTGHRTTLVWPTPRTALLIQATSGAKAGGVADLHEASARKSISMGAIAHGTSQNKDDAKDEDADHSEETPKRRTKGVTEYKAKFRPFSSYLYVDGNWRKTTKAGKNNGTNNNNEVWDDEVKGGVVNPDHAWYTEVVERIKKADEYRWRAHGTPLYGGEQVTRAYGPSGPGRQAELWSQVHDRTSLLALSLACSPKSICKADEKTPDRFKASAASHKSPSAAGASTTAAIHRRDIRPVSAERKKSPASEKKIKAVNTDAPPAASRPARFSSVAPVTSRGQKVKEDSRTGAGRASSAEPTSRRAAPTEQVLKRTTAPSSGVSSNNKKEEKRPNQSSTTTAAGNTFSSSRPRTVPGAKSSPTKEPHQQGSTPVSRPRPVTRPTSQTTSAPSQPAAVNGEDGKIWLKPSTAPSKDDKDDLESPASPAEDAGEALTNGEALSPEMEAETSLGTGGPSAGERRRPCTLPAVNGVDGQVNGQHYSSPSPLPEPHTGPVPLTTVRSPEEVTGVKSPDPESWTVPLETNKGLEWTDGHTPVSVEPARVKSPPLSYKSHQLISSPQSSYGQVPASPLNSFNDPEEAKTTAPVSDATVPVSGAGVESSSGTITTTTADVLDRARNRLDQFWSKSK